MMPSRPTSSLRAMAADVACARSRLNAPVLAAIAVLAVFLPVAPARAASLQKVNTSEWSVAGLPSYVSMYIYVPDQLAAKPPIVVGPHHCQGTGPGTFNEMSSLVSIANRVGFIMIFPEPPGKTLASIPSSPFADLADMPNQLSPVVPAPFLLVTCPLSSPINHPSSPPPTFPRPLSSPPFFPENACARGPAGQPGSGGNSAPGGSSGTRGGNAQSTNIKPGSGEAGGCNCVLGSHTGHARTGTVAISSLH